MRAPGTEGFIRALLPRVIALWLGREESKAGESGAPLREEGLDTGSRPEGILLTPIGGMKEDDITYIHEQNKMFYLKNNNILSKTNEKEGEKKIFQTMLLWIG